MAEYIEREELREVLVRYLNAAHVQIKHSVGAGMRIAINSCIELLDNAPTIDAIPVVRCRDCKHYHADTLSCDFTPHAKYYERPNWYEDDFCSYGERRDTNG